MVITRKPTSTVDVLVTREVRWFSRGPLPDFVRAWFISAPAVTIDRRVDHYDLTAARDGIGRKHRNGTLLDVKSPLAFSEYTDLAPGIAGHVEDWIKVSRPIDDLAGTDLSEPMTVDKHLHTRRFGLDGTSTGCEVELAEVRTSSATAWSLCFETFGEPTYRNTALRMAFDRFLAETPLPDGLEFTSEDSLSYPAWLGRLDAAVV